MINVHIDPEAFHTGSYCGRRYAVHSGESAADGNGSVLHNIMIFSPDEPLKNASVRVRVMAVTEYRGKIYYICAGEETIIYEPLIREVLSGREDFNPARITCLFEKSCGAVIFRRHSGNVEYLLIKNRKGNNWGFPKGHMEIHEDERQTAVREVLEETGLNIEPLEGFRTISEYHPKGRITKQVIFFVAEMPGEEIVIQKSEIERFIWADYSLAVRTFRFNNDKKVLAQARDWIIKNLYY
jgi:ADP-ribose pyrophosphatase